MKSNQQHPLSNQPYVRIVRHANGVAIGDDYNASRDARTPDDVHVFTSFQELTDFLKGWWPEAGKE